MRPLHNIYFLLVIAISFISCMQRSGVKHDPHSNTASAKLINANNKYDLPSLKKQKAHIDSIAADTDQIIVMVKIPGKDEPIKVVNNNYPDEIETTYNFLMTKDGKIVYAVEIPYSESGDWFISYRSYFNKDGSLFAFERKANFFNSECTTTEDGVAYELLTKFYNSTHVVDSVHSFTEKGGKPLKGQDCAKPYEYPYKVITDVDSFLSAGHIHIVEKHKGMIYHKK